jgi:hypothetical protein
MLFSKTYIQYINEPTSNNIKQSNVLTIYLVGNSDNQLVRKDIDVNEHERLSNFTLRHKLK